MIGMYQRRTFRAVVADCRRPALKPSNQSTFVLEGLKNDPCKLD